MPNFTPKLATLIHLGNAIGAAKDIPTEAVREEVTKELKTAQARIKDYLSKPEADMYRKLYEFIHEDHEGCKVELSFDDHNHLPDILEKFEHFLKATGYYFDGMVGIREADEKE